MPLGSQLVQQRLPDRPAGDLVQFVVVVEDVGQVEDLELAHAQRPELGQRRCQHLHRAELQRFHLLAVLVQLRVRVDLDLDLAGQALLGQLLELLGALALGRVGRHHVAELDDDRRLRQGRAGCRQASRQRPPRPSSGHVDDRNECHSLQSPLQSHFQAIENHLAAQQRDPRRQRQGLRAHVAATRQRSGHAHIASLPSRIDETKNTWPRMNGAGTRPADGLQPVEARRPRDWQSTSIGFAAVRWARLARLASGCSCAVSPRPVLLLVGEVVPVAGDGHLLSPGQPRA